jgi:hypothetical protein
VLRRSDQFTLAQKGGRRREKSDSPQCRAELGRHFVPRAAQAPRPSAGGYRLRSRCKERDRCPGFTMRTKSASDSGFRGKYGFVVWSKGERARQDATFRVWQRACAFLAISGRVRACSGARAGTGQTKRSLASATAERPRRGRGLTRSQIKLSIRTNLQTWSFRTSIRRVARPSFTDVRAIEPNSAVPTRACEVTR